MEACSKIFIEPIGMHVLIQLPLPHFLIFTSTFCWYYQFLTRAQWLTLAYNKICVMHIALQINSIEVEVDIDTHG